MSGNVETEGHLDYDITMKRVEDDKGSSYGKFRRCCKGHHISE